MKTVLFAGGGTGGHLMPALAIADTMVRLDPTVQPYFVGALRGVEAQVLPARPWRYTLLPFEPIYRKQWWKNWRLPISALQSMSGLRQILRREQPVLAIGTGGYASGPALFAAAAGGIPTVLQEQNAFPGFATRRLAGKARQIHLGFPEARSFLKPGPQTEILDSGNPIVPPGTQTGNRLPHTGKTVLVLGGSQGSLAINRVVAEAIDAGLWPNGVQLIWQTGAATFDDFRRLSSAVCQVSPFIDPIAAAYAQADLVVCRAGAMTLAEVAAWGLPGILIPLPTAAANHQYVNARAMADAGAALLLEQKSLTGAVLARTISDMLNDPTRLAAVKQAALRRARPGAAEDIARAALGLLSA